MTSKEEQEIRDLIENYLYGVWNIKKYVHNEAMVEGLTRRLIAFNVKESNKMLDRLVAQSVEGENIYTARDVVQVVPLSAIERERLTNDI